MKETTKQVLIKWVNLHEFESTWEDYSAMDMCFPEFHLEDKVAVCEGGNARNQGKPLIIHTYN